MFQIYQNKSKDFKNKFKNISPDPELSNKVNVKLRKIITNNSCLGSNNGDNNSETKNQDNNLKCLSPNNSKNKFIPFKLNNRNKGIKLIDKKNHAITNSSIIDCSNNLKNNNNSFSGNSNFGNEERI